MLTLAGIALLVSGVILSIGAHGGNVGVPGRGRAVGRLSAPRLGPDGWGGVTMMATMTRRARSA